MATRKGPIIEELPSDDESEPTQQKDNNSQKIIDGESDYSSDEEQQEQQKNNDDDVTSRSSDSKDDLPSFREPTRSKAKEIIDGPMKKKYSEIPEDELTQILAKAESLKQEGNTLYNNKDYEAALDKYTEAVQMLPEDHDTTAVLLGNRSAALVALERWERVIQDTSAAIQINPSHMKCYVRRAKAYERDNNFTSALEDWKKAAELDPQLREAQIALQRLPPLAKEQQEKEKEQMIGQLKDLGNKFLGMFGLSLDNFKMEQDPNSGSYKMNFTK